MSTKSRPEDCCTPPMRVEPLPAPERDALLGAFRALGEPTRLEIFHLVAAQVAPICVCDIVDRFDLQQPTISHHLKVLREAGLVTASRRGVWAYYAADLRGLAVLGGAVQGLVPAGPAAVR